MSTRKILHAADIHLDSPLQKLDQYENAPVDRIRSASRRALENMVQLAIAESVDLVVIAGDLYDGDWTDQNTGLFFVNQANQLVSSGIPMAVIRGNHDAMNLMTSSLPLPKNPDGSQIMLAADKVDQRTFESIGVAVHGRSFRSRKESENLAITYPKPLGGLFNLGLLHTCLEGNENHARYAPCTSAQLADKNYDYWALGHIHQRGEHQIDGAAPVVFSGNIQGRHIRESGAKGCVIVDVDTAGQCTQTFHPLDVVRWQVCRIDATGLDDADEVQDAFRDWLGPAIQSVQNRLLVTRVEIVGATKLHTQLHRMGGQLTASLRAATVAFGDQVWLENVKLKTRALASADSVSVDDGPMKSLAAAIAELQESADFGDILEQEFRGLIKKLPDELPIDTDGGLLDHADSERRQELLDSAAAEIRGRLSAAAGGKA